MTTVKERPILFNAGMSRAARDDRKNQTRRCVAPMPGFQSKWLDVGTIGQVPHGEIIKGGWQMHHPKAGTWHMGVYVEHGSPFGWIRCPYGEPGDRLWVREEYYQRGHWEPVEGVKTKTGLQKWKFVPESDDVIFGDSPEVFPFRTCRPKTDPGTVRMYRRLGRFMPRKYSRTTLEVVSVRVERLRDITAKSILAEGAVLRPHHVEALGKCPVSAFDGKVYVDLKRLWVSGWDSINGKKPGRAWADNPHVWVVEFRRVVSD